MSMIEITQKGNFNTTERWLRKLTKADLFAVLSKYGSIGQSALSNATPRETGLTASSWYYEVTAHTGYYRITWANHHVEHGVPIAIILQYGHGTGTGGYVEGRDYINPAIRPIFDQMAQEAWREVIKV